MSKKKRIGIIGGGISGTALGFNLSLYDDADVKRGVSAAAPRRNAPGRSACSTIP